MARIRIGILSDSHLGGGRALWDEVGQAFAGVDLILHSGDINHPLVLDRCEEWAPTLAALGNHDESCVDDPRVAPVQFLDVQGVRIAMVHDMEPEDEPITVLRQRYLKGEHADIFITGHTHYERMDLRDGVFQLNSGSAVLPHNYSERLGTVAFLEFDGGTYSAAICRLGETPGLRNPGREMTFDGGEIKYLD